MKKLIRLKYVGIALMLSISTLSYAWVWECENKDGYKMWLRSLSEEFHHVVIETSTLSGEFRVKGYWDGYNNGIMTGEKISIYYNGPYGRIENIDVAAVLSNKPTAYVHKIHFSYCKVDWNRNQIANKH